MRAIEIDDLYRFHSLGTPMWSPDGAWGVFLKWEMNRELNEYAARIWAVPGDGRGEARMMTDRPCAGVMCWTGDGRLLFESAGEGEGFLDDPAGAHGAALGRRFFCLDLSDGRVEAAFIPDCTPEKIAAFGNGRYAASASFCNQPEDDECLVIDEIPYQVNGSGFVNKVRRRLFLMDENGRLTDALTPPLFETNLWEVSPDQTCILYTGYQPDGVGHKYDGLYLYSRESGESRCLVKPGNFRIDGIAFGPDCFYAAASDQKRYGMDQNPVIYRVDAAGRMEEAGFWDGPSTGSSVNSDCRYGGGAVFAADKGTVWFVTTHWERSALVSVREGRAQIHCEMDENPEFIAVRDGRCLMIGTVGLSLQEAYLADLTGEMISVRRLTYFTGGSLTGCAVSAPEPLTFLDEWGNELQGWVIKPADFQADKRYPAILEIHGGPKTVYGPGFHHEMQVFAGHGYFVFYCNPPGSDGRGDEFADIRGRYGERDYRAIMRFTDLVLERWPCIDRHRVGVTGGSYGGFMTNWIIGHTDRFAAAVSQRSMANMVTLKATTDIGHYSILDHQRADVGWNVEELWRQSPLRYAGRCSTPTLFIHSDEDHRCWQVEAMQMFSELKLHGVETRLCLFKRENHELSRKGRPRNRARRLREMLEWMDSHLKKSDRPGPQ
ncbi:MAG: S9 family peptidase [Enterocloster asparagiformis]|nr:S9 family peptidase [Enterocloster asparagiformis]